MKYLLIFIFTVLTLPSFSQQGGAIRLGAGETAEVSGDADEHAEAVIDSDGKAEEFMQQNPSLEEFLKHQEELWLKEKSESKEGSGSKKDESLAPPSVLKETVKPEEVIFSAEPAAKTAAKKPVQSKAKAQVQQASVTKDASVSAEINNPDEQSSQEEGQTEETDNWKAFFKGLGFAFVLGVVVWLLSKYQ